MAYKSTERYQAFVKAATEAATHDIQLVYPVEQAKQTIARDGAEDADQRVPYSLVYHKCLANYVEQLCPEPSEGMSLASHCQHIRRWEIPRSEYPLGLSGYKSWRFKLNKFHTEKSHELLEQSGYPRTEDAEIFEHIANLIQKKTLKGGNDKGEEEMQIFEDAICLTFLELEFAEFAAKHDEDKMIKIVQKTWGKMGHRGRDYAMQQLAGQLSEDARALLLKALA